MDQAEFHSHARPGCTRSWSCDCFPQLLIPAHFDAIKHIVFQHVTPETVSPSFSLSLSISPLYLLSFCKPHTRDGVMIHKVWNTKNCQWCQVSQWGQFSIMQVRGTENAVFLSPWGPSKKRPPMSRQTVQLRPNSSYTAFISFCLSNSFLSSL